MMSFAVAPNISSWNSSARETPPPLYSLEERRLQLRESATRPNVAKKSRNEESGFVDQADCAAAGAIARDPTALSVACRTPVADVARLASRVAEHLNALPIPSRTTEAFDPHLDGLARALSSACVRWRDRGAEFEAELRRRVTELHDPRAHAADALGSRRVRACLEGAKGGPGRRGPAFGGIALRGPLGRVARGGLPPGGAGVRAG
jgi:hypothetical protein